MRKHRQYQYRSRRLGLLFTTGDLGSAIGPLLAFALIPLVGIQNLYLLAALLLFPFLRGDFIASPVISRQCKPEK